MIQTSRLFDTTKKKLFLNPYLYIFNYLQTSKIKKFLSHPWNLTTMTMDITLGTNSSIWSITMRILFASRQQKDSPCPMRKRFINWTTLKSKALEDLSLISNATKPTMVMTNTITWEDTRDIITLTKSFVSINLTCGCVKDTTLFQS